MSNQSVPMVELRNASKVFGSVIALSNVTMSVHAGEVMCLLGDNGAGKSTLIKIFAGVHQQTESRSLSRVKKCALILPVMLWRGGSPPCIRTWR